MMKRLLLTVLLGCLYAVLTGCGGGNGTTGQARGVAHVTLSIAMPSRSAAGQAGIGRSIGNTRVAEHAGQVGRLIPSDTNTVTITYFDATDTQQTDGPLTLPLKNPIPLEIGAGFKNQITVTASDSSTPANIVAIGSDTVDVAPDGGTGQPTSITITLQSTVSAANGWNPVLLVDGASASSPSLNDSVTHQLSIEYTNATATKPVIPDKTNGAAATWTTSSKAISLTPNADGFTASVQKLQKNAAGASVTVAYTDHGQLIRTDTLTISLPTTTLTQFPPVKINGAGGQIAATNSFDIGSDGYALFYDPSLKIPGTDGGTPKAGWSRVVQFPAPSLTQSTTDSVDFDTSAAPTYAGAKSRMVYLGAGNAAWAIVKNDQSTVTAFGTAAPPPTRAGSVKWSYPPAPIAGLKILDLDYKPAPGNVHGNVYLLESIGAGFRIEILNAANGTLSGSIVLTVPAFTPANLAVVNASNTETDYYVSENAGKRIAKIANSGQSIFATIPGAVTITDMAASGADARYLYVLTATGTTGSIQLVSTIDGSVSGTQPLTNAGAHLSVGDVAISASAPNGVNLYALESTATGAAIEGFTLP